MLEDICRIYETNQIDSTDSISRVLEESGRKKKLDVAAWTTAVFYDNAYDNLIENDSEEDDNEENDSEENDSEDNS